MGDLCLLIIVFESLCALVRSDGEPTGEREDKIRSVIKDAKKACKKSHVGEGAVAFEFAQVRSAVLFPGTPAATHSLVWLLTSLCTAATAARVHADTWLTFAV